MKKLKPVEQTNQKVHVCVDPRVALISIIQVISHYREVLPVLLNAEDFPYARTVMAHFSAYSGHPAVIFFDEVSGQPGGFNFMAPPMVMLYLTPNLTPRADVIWPDALLDRIGGRRNLDLFLNHLRDFRSVTGFDAFYQRYGAYYETLIDQVVGKLGAKDYIGEIESFYGTKQNSYTVILAPLYGHVGFGPLVETTSGERYVYNILGPQMVRDGDLFFGDERYFSMMQRHEFSHSFVNPLTDKYWDHVKDYAHLYDELPEQKICGAWQECINEYVIRAVTTYLAFQDSKAEGEVARETEWRRNVVLIDDLLAQVRFYAESRDRYPTFEAYYPRLLETFTMYKENHD